jgi:lysophospholipase L1-like esterase
MTRAHAAAATGLRLVATLGDSIAAGTAAQRDRLWPELMMEWLSHRAPVARHRDFSVDGATSADVAYLQAPEALREIPDLAIVICGANDVLLHPRPDMEAVGANLGLILGRLLDRLPADRVVIATYPNFAPFLAWRPRSKARVAAGLTQLNEAIRESADAAGAICVDLASSATQMDRQGAFLGDGVHPSALGHERIATAVVNVLADRLGPRDPRPYPWEQR